MMDANKLRFTCPSTHYPVNISTFVSLELYESLNLEGYIYPEFLKLYKMPVVTAL